MIDPIANASFLQLENAQHYQFAVANLHVIRFMCVEETAFAGLWLEAFMTFVSR